MRALPITVLPVLPSLLDCLCNLWSSHSAVFFLLNLTSLTQQRVTFYGCPDNHGHDSIKPKLSSHSYSQAQPPLYSCFFLLPTD